MDNADNTDSTDSTLYHLKTLLVLALPLLVGQLARTAMGVIDIAIAGSIGTSHMAALAIGGSVWFPVFVFGSGTMQCVVPRIASAHARQDHAETVKFIHQGVWLALSLSIMIAAAVAALRPLLPLLGMADDVRAITAKYLLALALGAPGILLFFTFRNVAQSLGDTRTGMKIGLAGLALNIPLSYTLAHGLFGLPVLGAVGCGIAFCIVNWCCGLGFGVWLAFHPRYRKLRIFRGQLAPDRHVLLKLAKIGAPIALAFFCEVLLLDAVGLLVAGLDTASVAAHGIVLNITGLIYTLPCALSSIVTVRVAHYVGKGENRAAASVAKTGVALWIVLSCVVAGALMLFGKPLIGLYTADPRVVAAALGVLAFAMAMQLADGIQTVMGAALRGYEDNHAIFTITVASYWAVGLPVAFALGRLGWYQPLHGLSGYWTGVAAGLACCALALMFRLGVVARKAHA